MSPDFRKIFQSAETYIFNLTPRSVNSHTDFKWTLWSWRSRSYQCCRIHQCCIATVKSFMLKTVPRRSHSDFEASPLKEKMNRLLIFTNAFTYVFNFQLLFHQCVILHVFFVCFLCGISGYLLIIPNVFTYSEALCSLFLKSTEQNKDYYSQRYFVIAKLNVRSEQLE